MNTIKDILRETCITLHLDLTKNLKYDRLTRAIFKKHLNRDHNCIDIGCHKGEILDLMLQCAPEGRHFAFEPIPALFNNLKVKYKDKAEIYPYALSEKQGESTFQFVKNAPAYSGINKRRYDIVNPDIEEINVQLSTLDAIIPPSVPIHLMKIDVEGGELGVLKGAKNVLARNHPIILFESGKGSSDYYGATSFDVYSFLTAEGGYKIYTLQAFIFDQSPLDEGGFAHCFETNEEYYFIAA